MINPIAIEGYSPVSYFEKGVAEKGDARYAVNYRGVIYHLASAEQVRTFNAGPAKYEPAYDGWCAYGAAIGKKFAVTRPPVARCGSPRPSTLNVKSPNSTT